MTGHGNSVREGGYFWFALSRVRYTSSSSGCPKWISASQRWSAYINSYRACLISLSAAELHFERRQYMPEACWYSLGIHGSAHILAREVHCLSLGISSHQETSILILQVLVGRPSRCLSCSYRSLVCSYTVAGLTTIVSKESARIWKSVESLHRLCEVDGPDKLSTIAFIDTNTPVICGASLVSLEAARDFIRDFGSSAIEILDNWSAEKLRLVVVLVATLIAAQADEMFKVFASSSHGNEPLPPYSMEFSCSASLPYWHSWFRDGFYSTKA